MHHTQRPRERLGGAGMRHLLVRVGTLGLPGRSQCPVSRAEGGGLRLDLLHREVRICWS